MNEYNLKNWISYSDGTPAICPFYGKFAWIYHKMEGVPSGVDCSWQELTITVVRLTIQDSISNFLLHDITVKQKKCMSYRLFYFIYFVI